MQATSWWEERITGALMLVLDLPAPRQPVAGRARGRRDVPARSAPRPTARRSCAPSPRPPTGRPTAPRARCGRTGGTSAACGSWSSTPAAGRILGGETRLDGRRARVRVDRGPGRGRRVRPPRRRDVGAVAAAAGAPRRRVRGTRRLCDGSRGRLVARALGEGPARRRSRALGGVRRLVRAARQAVRPGRVAARTARRAPATICVLSGDVHHTYVSEAAYPQPMQSRVYQLTCSPMHNTSRSRCGSCSRSRGTGSRRA